MSVTADLAVILVAVESIDSVRRTLRHLRAQTARDRIELVLVAPDAALVPGDVFDGFATGRVVVHGP